MSQTPLTAFSSSALAAAAQARLQQADAVRAGLLAAGRVLVSVAVLAMLFGPHIGGSLAAPGPSTSALSTASTTCDAPVDLRERANHQYDELRQLDDDQLVSVPDGTLSLVQKHVADGNSSMNLRDYCQARTAYQAALNITRPTLKETYRTAANNHINATAGMINAERADGNPNPAAAELAAQVTQQRQELDAAETLPELRDQYRAATDLHDHARDRLPTTPIEMVFETVIEQPLISGWAAMMTVLAGILAAALWLQAQPSQSSPDHVKR